MPEGKFYDRYWEMQKGGPYESAGEIYKCKDCGAETWPEDGWNGRPNPGNCGRHCASKTSDWRPGQVSPAYRRNFDRIFPKSPGAGL